MVIQRIVKPDSIALLPGKTFWIIKKDTIYYLESSSCLNCIESFWNFYDRHKETKGYNPKLILQIDNKRISLNSLIPDGIESNAHIRPIYSNSISKLIDQIGRTGYGAYKITIQNDSIESVVLLQNNFKSKK